MRVKANKKTDVELNKLAYDDVESAVDYEKQRFRSWLGKARYRREQQAAHNAIQQFMPDATVLDCPCGNGRWFSLLSLRAKRIVGIDVAPAMIEVAAQRQLDGVEIDCSLGDAEQLDLPDEAVQHVFCFALMKHIPPEKQWMILKEFRRVCSGRMAVSFCLTNPASEAFWRLRGACGYPISPQELERMASEASWRVGAIYSVGVPVLGLEAIVVLEPA